MIVTIGAMKLPVHTLYVFIFVCLWGCTPSNEARITGTITGSPAGAIAFEHTPLHYKFSDARSYTVTPGADGSYRIQIPADSVEVIQLRYTTTTLPVVIRPGARITLNLDLHDVEATFDLNGYGEQWAAAYKEYILQERDISREIRRQLPAFRRNEPTAIQELYKLRIQLATTILGDTPFRSLVHRNTGEYLVRMLEFARYRTDWSPEKTERLRTKVMKKAQDTGFFTLESLRVQRAGIRDFTDAWVKTFGVQQDLETAYGQNLMEYDWKRLGYDVLDSLRMSVVQQIPDRNARAHAELFLVAERLSEAPFSKAETAYHQYLSEYADYSAYTAFLTELYTDIKQVMPGQPAVPFELTDESGARLTLTSFEGTYLLLDFWASWCAPCFREFPHMVELYERFGRDDFNILGISLDQDKNAWQHILTTHPHPWKQVYAGNGFEQETFRAYRGGGIPFYILIGRDGIILRHNDIRPSFNLGDVLDELLYQEKITAAETLTRINP